MSKTLSLSPDRGEFSMTRYREKLEVNPDDEDAFKILSIISIGKPGLKNNSKIQSGKKII